jgi:phosphoglycolate phosphatase-like HAD superfamily hydrolase
VSADDPTGLLGAMTEELDLDKTQESEIRRLVVENAGTIRKLRGTMQPTPDEVTRQSEMFQELRKARAAEDEERTGKLMQELKQMREKRMEAAGPVRDQIAESRRKLEQSIRALLRTEQLSTFDRIWTQHMDPSARYAGRTRSPQALKSLVEGLPNLSTDQKQQLDQLFRNYFEAVRAQAKESDENARGQPDPRMLTQLHDNAMRILTPEQRAMIVARINRDESKRPVKTSRADTEADKKP